MAIHGNEQQNYNNYKLLFLLQPTNAQLISQQYTSHTIVILIVHLLVLIKTIIKMHSTYIQ